MERDKVKKIIFLMEHKERDICKKKLEEIGEE